MIVFPNFANELAELDTRLTVIRNNNYPQLANIMLSGRDVCAIPSGEIKDEVDPSYTITFPNGYTIKHRSRTDALAIVKNTLDLIKTTEGNEIFFSKE